MYYAIERAYLAKGNAKAPFTADEIAALEAAWTLTPEASAMALLA